MAARIAVLLVVLATLCSQNQSSQVYEEREKDVYAIYSLMFSGLEKNRGPYIEDRILIDGEAVAGDPEKPCIYPPFWRAMEYREILADFAFRKTWRTPLKRRLSIKKPYELLSRDDVKAFAKGRVIKDGTPLDPRFREDSDIFSVSEVSFNSRRTLAVAAFSRWCGGLCGASVWQAFEKTDSGQWEQVSWPACFTIY